MESADPKEQPSLEKQPSPPKESSQDNEISDSEDVPGDFFDDFLKEDFMSGLDIVDEDDEDEVPFPLIDYHVQKSKPAVPNNTEGLETNEFNENSNDTVDLSAVVREKSASSKENDTDIKIDTDNTTIQINATAEKKTEAQDTVNDKVEKTRENNSGESDKRHDRKVERQGNDSRRDPNKTRRDIQRDKMRCEKDREKKIISEKLQLVETGLVPPGMELEIDVNDLGKQTGELYPPGETKKKRSPKRSKNSSPKKRSRSSGLTNRSSTHRRRSPRPSPRRSPTKRRRSSPHQFRSSRGSDYHGRSRYSPRNRRSRSHSPKRRRDEKKSFLEEIAEKLNETNPSHSQGMVQPVHNNYQGMQYLQQAVHVPQTYYPQQSYESYPQAMNQLPLMSAPVPTPVPAPNPPLNPVYQQAQQMYDPYDQSFFIGGSSNVPMTHQPQQSLPSPSKQPMTTNKNVNIPTSTAANNKLPEKALKEVAVSKLFHDKKITLSEFLAITAKPQVITATRDYVREKIKVITRCQDAIKFLGGLEKKYSGKLIVKRSEKGPVEKYKSPLLKMLDSTIPFTQAPSETKTQSKIDIDRLLKHLGLKDAPIEINDSADEAEDGEPLAPPPPQISMGSRKGKNKDFTDSSFPSQQSNRPCYECNQRKKRTFTSNGVQCDTPMTYSVSTQVSEEDFRLKISKNQSLAAMTPAQLLANTGQRSQSNMVDHQDPFMKQPSFPSRNPYGQPPFYMKPDRGQGRGRGRGMQTFL